ncbi:glutaredoxin family protein [Bacillus sp. HMF5848]|uniref:glutaredoxin family protein n=1 Tax=Bacillus sp. HMF5848 TaxID=2495421 RepID=UPI000F7984D6|nr:glutaredoxin family protein [Bacillus sp. HMF5848]RSK27652.1 glutaredoxin family protein [Bacillus sp. HMF5848]
MTKPIIIYSTNDCVECEFVKKMLQEEGIAFVVRNISTSEQYKKEVEQYGFLGVPVIVKGNKAVKGLNQELINLLKEA